MTSRKEGLAFFLLSAFLLASFGDEHSVYYLYTMQSKYSVYNIYDCTAVTLLDGRQIFFYNSTDESRTPKQDWLKHLSEFDCARSTDKLKHDRQLLNKLLEIQMKASGHFQSDGHVLQWIYGCEGELHSDGSLTILNTTNAYGYDGEDLIHFDSDSGRFLTPEKKKNRDLEEKWNSYLQQKAVKQCRECEDLLKMYSQYNTTESKPSQAPPDVYMFAKKSMKDTSKLILTCMTTHFYPINVKMRMRKFGTFFPEHLITSSGVKPNDDGTYQLRKSVEIQEDDSADYTCFVTHRTLQKPMTEKWGNYNYEIPQVWMLLHTEVSVDSKKRSFMCYMFYVHVRLTKSDNSLATT
ncbi:zinc-alpha-2-glycoprotein-like [Astyanax mexicanus]|uniref:zinc-alpha-2-glycoprotein-like n=1 Tax=Astyanax mexicanus TaxID=7994 RepID=UPI0020CAE906|nr:zinc-alpha-2-glycoprotein-like [Astyanax mexicanus]